MENTKRTTLFLFQKFIFFLILSFLLPEKGISQTNEVLGRGVIAIRENPDTVFISWRYLSRDSQSVSFHVYRNGKRLTKKAIKDVTFFRDAYSEKESADYIVYPVIKGKEDTNGGGHYQLPANAPIGYLNIPLDKPADGISPAGESYSYSANDASIGDVNGDGEYEIILKWDPSNAHDNAHDGYTGNVLIDCYTLKGEKLWRIDLGKNIRAGAHYTQFMVYDLDGDGKAEIVMKTADGAMDGIGNIIGNPDADYREPGDPQEPRGGDFPAGDPRGKGSPSDPLKNQGRILTGPEYLTIFDGQTGAAMHTIDYVPERGNLMDWGDNRANRSDRFLACVAHLGGTNPCVVMCRGYYTRAVLVAYDWNGKDLKQRWIFDSSLPGWEGYSGQGNHNLRVGDVDGDGFDEIIYGSCAIDHDGKGLYTTGMGHGDALHLSQFSPDMKGLQVWDCHENKRDGSTLRDAATGEVIFQVKSKTDVGRAMAADIHPGYPGMEMWSYDSGGLRSVKGEVIQSDLKNLPVNMAVWWDGDLLREMLDKNTVSKYNWNTGICEPLVTFENALSNNGTKATPCLQGDIIGDWREEVLMQSKDNTALHLYMSTIPTEYRFHTFLEDRVYRISIATQNVAYNQPTQAGFYFGSELKGTFRGYTFKVKD